MKFENKKQVVVVESYPTDMLAKIAKVLKRKNYQTILINISGNSEINFYKEAYDIRMSLNSKFIKVNIKNILEIILYLIKKLHIILKNFILIKKINPYIVIGRANPNWLCVLFKHIFRKHPFIYFPYDIRSFCYITKEEAIRSGVPQFELNAERYCYENSDGIIHKGDKNELNLLDQKVLSKQVNIRVPVLHFLPYCLNELIIPINKKKLSTKDKEFHLVLVGHLNFEDISWVEMIKEILDQKLHIHLYGKTANLSDKELTIRIKNSKLKNLFNNKYLHIHKSVDQENLANEISKYDYGVIFDHRYNLRKNITTSTGNKISSYLEAGLPLVYFSNYKFINEILKQYNLDLNVEPDNLKNLKKMLKQQNYKRLIENIEKARKDFEMLKHIPRLEKFFEEAIKHKYGKLQSIRNYSSIQ